MEPNITIQTIEEGENSMFKDLLSCPFEIQPISKVENKYIEILRKEIESLNEKVRCAEEKEKAMIAKFNSKIKKIKAKQNALIEKLHRSQVHDMQLTNELHRIKADIQEKENFAQSLQEKIKGKDSKIEALEISIENLTAEVSKQKNLTLKFIHKYNASVKSLKDYKSLTSQLEKEFKSYTDMNIKLEEELVILKTKENGLQSKLENETNRVKLYQEETEKSKSKIGELQASLNSLKSDTFKDNEITVLTTKITRIKNELQDLDSKAKRKLHKLNQETLSVLTDSKFTNVAKMKMLISALDGSSKT
jgi:chromosome segregation ATPase